MSTTRLQSLPGMDRPYSLTLPFASMLMAALAIGAGCSSSDDENPADAIDDQLGATINATNHTALLEYLFKITNTTLVEDVPATVDRIYGDDVSGSTAELDFLTEISSTYDPASSSTQYVYACVDGGTYLFTEPGSVVGGGGGEFDACRFEGLQIDGSFYRTNTLVKYVFSPGWSWNTTYDAMKSTLESDGTVEVIDGDLNRFDGSNENTERWNISRYSRTSDAGETILTDAVISLYAGSQPDNPDFERDWQRRLSSDYTIQAPETGNSPLVVTTEEIFVSGASDSTYTSGVLQVRADDGSELRVVAANGDPDTFQVDVTGDGTTTSFTLTWEGTFSLRCLQEPQTTGTTIEDCR